MKITAIKAQVKNPDRVSVFVDEKYSFSLDLDQLIKTGISKGKEVTDQDVESYKKISDDGKVRGRALEWVLSRPHSTKELSDYLNRKKVDPETARGIVEEFKSKKYVDDQYFAKWWVSSRREYKQKSNRAISQELRQKGIDRVIIDQTLEETEVDELSALKAIIVKKSRLTKYSNDPVKFAQYLTRQGFSYSLVKEALRIENSDD